MIEQLSTFPDNVLAFVCRGQVTKADYDTVLVPAVEKALAKLTRFRLYYEIATDFTGIDPGAMSEDLRSAWSISRAGSALLSSPT